MHVAAMRPLWRGKGRRPRRTAGQGTGDLRGPRLPNRVNHRTSSKRWWRVGSASTSVEVTPAGPGLREGFGPDRGGRARRGREARVSAFVRYEVGEGIEKKQDDFVSEVMAQAKGGLRLVRPSPDLQAHTDQAQWRGAGGEGQTRIRCGHRREDLCRYQAGGGTGMPGRSGRRGRQLLPRCEGGIASHAARTGRLRRYARNRDERNCAAAVPGTPRRGSTRDVRDPHDPGGGNLRT